MKKIMFNDRYGLTQAVIEDRITMTRRIIRNLLNFDPRQDWMVWGNNKDKAKIDSHREVLDDNIYTVDVFWKHYCQWHFPSARESFSFLIDDISGKGTWEENPYVFAYTFELVKKNMTRQEFEEQIKDLVDDYLMSNDEDIDISVNMQRDDKWITFNLNLEIEED